MCGIAGLIRFNDAMVVQSELDEMSKPIEDRGPDHYGSLILNNVGLIHRRLSIIDLSPLGNQPMSQNQCHIVFNGEIYNFQEIKQSLLEKGYEFNSSTDTEVVLQGYIEWGIQGVLSRIDGMFAFSIYDEKKGEVYLSRDRFGQKPLYYFQDKSEFCFSSDIRSISNRTIELSINTNSIEYYLEELAMPQPYTIWNEVKQIKNGHYLKLDLVSGNGTEICYHQFKFSEDFKGSYSDAVKETEKKLVAGIIKRTISDVPIASFLSGGVDSGLIVSLLAQNQTEKINTFSVGFNEKEFNELDEARLVAERYDTNHSEIILEPKVEEDIYRILSDIGEPFGDSSLLPSYLVCKEMVKHFKVALSGDGGDELYGYPNYNYYYDVEKFLNSGNASKLKSKIQISKVFSRVGLMKNIGHFQDFLTNEPNADSVKRTMSFNTLEVKKLMNSNTTSFTSEYLADSWKLYEAGGITNKVISSSLNTRLLNDYLVKVDRSSMLNSLEVRSPFLDKELAQFAFGIPNKLKFNGGETKSILKELAVKHVDVDIRTREKSGFSVPLKDWFKNELKPLLLETLSKENLKKHNVFDYLMVEKTMNDHFNGNKDNKHQLWGLLSFQLWYNQNGRN